MDNLRSALIVIFVDADFDRICNSFFDGKRSLSIDERIDDIVFPLLFWNRNQMHGSNVVRSIREIVSEYWMKWNNDGTNRFFNILRHASNDILTWDCGSPVCKSVHYMRWNELTAAIDENFLTVAYRAHIDALNGQKCVSFAWRPCVVSDSIRINEILRKGLAELHFHLKASSLNFDINWMAIMNNIGDPRLLGKFEKIDNRGGLYCKVIKAAAIRFFLYRCLNSPTDENEVLNKDYSDLCKILRADNVEELQSIIKNINSAILVSKRYHSYLYGNHHIDYAIPTSISEVDYSRYMNIPLIGERKLIYDCLYHIYSGQKCDVEYGSLLYLYVLAKNQFRRAFIQSDHLEKGFSNFQLYEERKKMFAVGRYEKLLICMAVRNTIANQSIDVLEVRISPQNTCHENKKEIKRLNKCIDGGCWNMGKISQSYQNKVRLGYILHFIKSADCYDDSDLYCRNYHKRREIDRQAKAIVNLLKRGSGTVWNGRMEYDNGSPQIIGIDAANSEFGCRPEVFGTAFRMIRQADRYHKKDFSSSCPQKRIGCTFHVGEDFYDIIDGLRAIDEALLFLNLVDGDRLGHAVALGLNVSEYYKRRHRRIIMPKQELLDNCVWILAKMDEYSIMDKDGFRGRMQVKACELMEEMYFCREPYQEYYNSWLLRGDSPLRVETKGHFQKYNENVFAQEIRAAHKSSKAQELYRQYHYERYSKAKGRENCEICFEFSDFSIIEQVQLRMRDMIAMKNIVIETNPTSNMKITDVERYCEHPIVICQKELLQPLSVTVYNEHPQLEMSINTDDQGVFNTSLEKEYTLMAVALLKERNEDGTPKYNPERVYGWLESVRQAAYRHTFLKEPVDISHD